MPLQAIALKQRLGARARLEALRIEAVRQQPLGRAVGTQLLADPLGGETAHWQQALQLAQAPAFRADAKIPNLDAMGTAPTGSTRDAMVQVLQRCKVGVGGEQQPGAAAPGGPQHRSDHPGG